MTAQLPEMNSPSEVANEWAGIAFLLGIMLVLGVLVALLA